MKNTMSMISRMLSTAFIALIVVGAGLFAALPASGQEMECDTDPAVSIRANDRNMITVHVHYRASLLLPNGTVVPMNAMATHLLTKTTRSNMTATKQGNVYEVKVTSNTAHWLSSLPFTVKSYLVHVPTGIVGPTSVGSTGTGVVAKVYLPADNLTTIVYPGDGW